MVICFYSVQMEQVIQAFTQLTNTMQKLFGKRRSSDTKKNFSFCTPLIVPRGIGKQIISPASEFVFSYSLEGRELWKSKYPGGYSVVPRPVFHNGNVFVSSGYDRPTLYAIRTDGTGDVTDSKTLWKTSKSVPRNSSIVIVKIICFSWLPIME